MPGALRRMSIIVDAEDNATRTLNKINKEGDKTAKTLSRVQRGAGMAKKGMMVAGAGAAAAAAGFVKLVQFGSKIDQQFARIQGIGGYTAKELDKIRQRAVEIGQKTPIGIRESAEAFEELARAGYSSKQAIQASKGVTDMAIAGNMSMASAVESTVSSLQQFGLKANQAGTAANTLANVANTSTADVSDLSESLKYVGTTASQVGWSLGETTSTLGVLADAGMRGSTAGTALQNALANLINPTEKAQGAMKRLGVSTDMFTDKQGNLKDMGSIAMTLRDKFDKMGATGVERAKMLEEMFGKRGARAMGILIKQADKLEGRFNKVWGAQIRSQIEAQGKSVDDVIKRYGKMAKSGMSVKELSKKIQDELKIEADAADYLARKLKNGKQGHDELAKGIKNSAIASDVATKQMDTVAGQWEEFTGALETVAYQMYREIAPAIKSVLEQLAGLADSIGQNPAMIRTLATAFVVLSGALVAATVAFAGLWAYFTAFGLVLKAAAAIGTLTSAISAAGGITAFLVGGITTIMTVMGPLIAIIAVAAAAWYAYKNNVLGFRDAVDVVVRGVQKIVQWFGQVVRAGMWLANQLKGPLTAAWRVMAGAIRWVIDAVKGVLNWYDNLSPLGKMIIGIIMPIIPALSLLRKGVRMIGPAINWIREQWAILANRIKPMKIARGIMQMVNQIGKALKPMIQWFAGFGNRLMVVGRKGGKAFTKLTNALQGKLNNAVKGAQKWLKGLIRWLGGVFRGANKAARGFVQWATKIRNKALAAVRQFVRSLRAQLKPAFKTAGEAAKTAGRIIGQAWNTAKRIQTRAIRQIIKWIRQMNTAIKNITGVDILRTMSNAWKDVQKKVKSAKKLVDGFGKAMNKIGDGVKWLFGGGKGGSGPKKATVKMEGGKDFKATARNTKVMSQRLNKVATNTGGQKKSMNRAAKASEKTSAKVGGVRTGIARTNTSVGKVATHTKKTKDKMNSVNNHIAKTNQSVKDSKKFNRQAAKNTKQAATATKQTKKSSQKTANNVVKLPGFLKKIQKNTHNIHTNTNQLEDQGKKQNKSLKTIITTNRRRNKLLNQLLNTTRTTNKILRKQSGILKRISGTLRKQSAILRRIASNIKKQTGHLKRIAGNTKNMTRTLKTIQRNTKNAVSAIKKNTSAIKSLRGAMRSVANRPVRVNVRNPGPRRQMAAGGVVTQPTEALIGEAQEDEAVIPLSQFPGILAKTLGKMAPGTPRQTGGSDRPVEISINQSPSVEVNASGGRGGISAKQIRRELDQAMEETREETLEQLDDMLDLGLASNNTTSF